MSELEIRPELVGQRVCNPARPEWGAGTVLRVQSTRVNEQVVHRVSVQFESGHRTLVIPPGRLSAVEDEPQRAAGWLDRAGRHTLDERLVSLPEAVREFLGTSAQRLIVVARLYELRGDPAELLRWARSQTGVKDPLAHWTRDELHQAFAEFRRRRDDLLRKTLTALRSAGGNDAVEEALGEVSAEAAAAIRASAGLANGSDAGGRGRGRGS